MSDDHGRAISLMLLASFCYAGMGVFVKLAATNLDSFTVVFGRSVVVVLLVGAMMLRRGLTFRWGNRRAMALRCAAGVTAVCLYFYAISAVPLANAVTIQWSSPLFVALFGGLILKEYVSRKMLVCIVAALVGVGLIVSPDVSSFQLDSLAAVGSAILAGVSYVFVRELRHTDRPESIVFSFSAIAIVVTSPALFFLEHIPTGTELLALAGVGVFGLGGQLLMTYAMRLGEAAFVSAFSYATVLFSAVAGYFLFDERPTWLMALGATLVIAAGVWLSFLKGRMGASEETGPTD